VSPPIPAPITTACLPITVDAIAASLLRAPPATEVPTPDQHIAMDAPHKMPADAVVKVSEQHERGRLLPPAELK
jgi:hypothetical protein